MYRILLKLKVPCSFFAVGIFLQGCSILPKQISIQEQQDLLIADRQKAQQEVQPVGSQLTMSEAVARGLKYNLDYRSKLMEQAIAMGSSQLSNYDMLPKVLANAGYSSRNNYFITEGIGAYSGTPAVGEPFITSAKNYSSMGLNLNWSLLDFGVSYFNARQNADRIFVAAEKRRRTMHVLIQDIQTAYLRAAAAQKLNNDLLRTIEDASIALANSQKVEKQGLRSPIDALRYQKSLLDNVKILETIYQELSTARIELNQLINLSVTANYRLDDPDTITLPNTYSNTDIKEFEIRALMFNADLTESLYNARIAVEETRKSMLKVIPGLNFNVGPQTTNNNFWVNQSWVEGAANISFNLWNFLSAPTAMKLADQNKELAQQKRMIVQMAVVSQVYLAKMGLESTMQIYRRSADIDQVDSKIAKINVDKERAGSASQAERVASDASVIISKLRKYQALSQLFAASGRMQASTGLEPQVNALHEISLKDLTTVVKTSFDLWNSGKLPPLPLIEVERDLAAQTNSFIEVLSLESK